MIGWFGAFRKLCLVCLLQHYNVDIWWDSKPPLNHYSAWKAFGVDWWTMVNCFRLCFVLLFCIYLR